MKGIAVAFLATLLGVSRAAAAQEPASWADCFNRQAADAAVIASCSTVIGSTAATPARRAEARYNRGVRYYNQDRLDAALADFTEAFRLNPNPAYIHERGYTYFRGGDFSRAFDDFSESIRLSPDNPLFLSNRGHVQIFLGNPQAAVVDLTAAIQFKAKYSNLQIVQDLVAMYPFLYRGEAYVALGEYAPADDDLTAVIRKEPSNGDALRTRCNARLYLKRYPEAIDDCSKAIAVNGSDKEAYWLRSLNYRATGKSDLQLADLDRYIAIGPANEVSTAALLARAELLFKRSDYTRALRDFEKAAAQSPRDAEAIYGRGVTKKRLNDRAGGNADIATATQLQPNIAATAARLGLVDAP